MRGRYAQDGPGRRFGLLVLKQDSDRFAGLQGLNAFTQSSVLSRAEDVAFKAASTEVQNRVGMRR